mmetsp:Transcript_46292/g.122197  ORF Transcript_46292/g.122197 Transcript_46292/m.122197 type:complete len:472 (-) Transcript_46292:197-1612(-)
MPPIDAAQPPPPGAVVHVPKPPAAAPPPPPGLLPSPPPPPPDHLAAAFQPQIPPPLPPRPPEAEAPPLPPGAPPPVPGAEPPPEDKPAKEKKKKKAPQPPAELMLEDEIMILGSKKAKEYGQLATVFEFDKDGDPRVKLADGTVKTLFRDKVKLVTRPDRLVPGNFIRVKGSPDAPEYGQIAKILELDEDGDPTVEFLDGVHKTLYASKVEKVLAPKEWHVVVHETPPKAPPQEQPTPAPPSSPNGARQDPEQPTPAAPSSPRGNRQEPKKSELVPGGYVRVLGSKTAAEYGKVVKIVELDEDGDLRVMFDTGEVKILYARRVESVDPPLEWARATGEKAQEKLEPGNHVEVSRSSSSANRGKVAQIFQIEKGIATLLFDDGVLAEGRIEDCRRVLPPAGWEGTGRPAKKARTKQDAPPARGRSGERRPKRNRSRSRSRRRKSPRRSRSRSGRRRPARGQRSPSKPRRRRR